MARTENLILAELTAHHEAPTGLVTHYFGTGRGLTTKPDDTPAHTVYTPRIVQPGNFEEQLTISGLFGTQSAASSSRGVLELNNADGGLESLHEAGVDGQPLVLRLGPSTGRVDTDFKTIFTGTMAYASITRPKAQVYVRNRADELAVALQAATFAGTNVGTGGLEGTENDLKSRPLPVLLGYAQNFIPLLANVPDRIYVLNSDSAGNRAAITSVESVWDRGVEIPADSTPDYADYAALYAATVTPGKYATCLAEGLLRLGSKPTDQIRVYARAGATLADRAPGAVIKMLLTDWAGFSASEYDSDDFDQLAADCGYESGLFIDSETTIAAVINQFAAAIGAWWCFSRFGVFRIRQLTDPSVATADFALTESYIISLKRVELSQVAGSGVPAKKVKLGWGLNHAPQTGSQLVETVDEDRRAALEKSYRYVESTTAQPRHKLAVELSWDSILSNSTDTQNECDRRLALFGTQRSEYEFSSKIADAQLETLELGRVISLTHSKYSLSAGKKFVVTYLRRNLRTGIVQMRVWG